MCQGDVTPDMTVPEVIERVKHNVETLAGVLDNAHRVADARRSRLVMRDLADLTSDASDMLIKTNRLFTSAARAAADAQHEHKRGC